MISISTYTSFGHGAVEVRDHTLEYSDEQCPKCDGDTQVITEAVSYNDPGDYYGYGEYEVTNVYCKDKECEHYQLPIEDL